MELSQQKKQVIFKTCFIVFLVLIVGYLSCLIYDKIVMINYYKNDLLNYDTFQDVIEMYHMNILILTIECVKYALYSLILLSLIINLFISKNYIKLLCLIQLTLFLIIFSILNISLKILTLVFVNSSIANHMGSNLTFVVIILFVILIIGLLLLIPQIIKEIKLLKNKPSSDPTC